LKTSILILPLLFCSFAPRIALSAEFVTQHYKLIIIANCKEGNVTCDDVDLIAINRESENIIFQTKGRTQHSLCADGVTPCGFIGYEFKIKNVTYFVTSDDTLIITADKSDIVVKEKGVWEKD
jgi:hypothetical protein